ncbi:hypothetical protein IMZ29_22365, partial [Achromobacter sp. GG226]|uniref:hypothetical protein n=1 Tax=Verticiella alkaliphila TaxID=2779529 RepID=UPI001C0E3D9D
DSAERCLTHWQTHGLARPRLWHTELDVTTGDASLFKGAAGWVYLQARLLAPERIPCALLPLPRG